MSLNRFHPHLFILPEDDANRQMATGFVLHFGVASRKVQVLPEAGGWCAVLDRFEKDHVASLRKYADGRMLLLLDFDAAPDRFAQVQAKVPGDLRDRVFILGVKTTPEELRGFLGISPEKIGSQLAGECCDGTDATWSHELLAHNAAELVRMGTSVRSFLFP